MPRRRPPVLRLNGRSRPGRLRLWEDVIEALWGDLLPHGAVDIGVGENPFPAAEWAARLGGLTAVEVHPRRAAKARAHAGLTVLEVDALSHSPPGTAGVARCANLLRQYPTPQVPAAHAALVRWVRPGGVVAVGSCDRMGHVCVFHGLRRTPAGVGRERLVFATDFERGFAPLLFRDQLPRDLRRGVQPGTALGAFFAAWTARWTQTRGDDPRASFEDAGRLPDCSVHSLTGGARALVWCPPGGVPLAPPAGAP